MSTKERPPCGDNCRFRKRCDRNTRLCLPVQGEQWYCVRHCPCKGKKDETRTKRKYTTNKQNCDDCNPNRARCTLCKRCSYCCTKRGECVTKTPVPNRSNRDAIMAKIRADQAKTPLKMKLDTGELELKRDGKEDELFEALGIDRSAFRHLPPADIRQLSDAVANIEKRGDRAAAELVHVLDSIYQKAANILLPNDSDWLRDKHFQKLSKAQGQDIQRRQKVLEGIGKQVFDLANRMPNNTVTYRVARALIVCNTTNGDFSGEGLAGLNPPKFGRKDKKKPEPVLKPGFGRAARKRGREDMDKAMADQQDPKRMRRTVGRLSKENILRIVVHVLSFTQTLSWGTKHLKQNGNRETIQFPKLTRTHPIEVMFRDYAKKEVQLKFVKLDKDVQPPQRTIYFQIASMLTSKAEKSISCIDYVQDILINTSITVLTRIIHEVVAPTRQKKMKGHLRAVQHFLKYQYDKHLSSDSKICSHNIDYGLGLTPQSEDDDSASSTSCCDGEIKSIDQCPGCKFVEYFMQVLLPNEVEANRSKANEESVDDALRYIEHSLDRFRRYQAHRVRVVNQQRALRKLDIELKTEVLKTKRRSRRVKITIDYKQKYLPKRLRSSQMNDFGQRGITWHIVVVEYYEYEAPCEANNYQEQAVRVQVPLDQILNSGNKQDGPCVLAMLEAMTKMVEVELPFVEDIILVSDNANCYHSKDMILPICLLNQLSKGPKIVRFIHPETQDGKGPCDGHAGCAGEWVDDHFICTRPDGTLTYNEACTPAEVAHALCSNGGIKNSAVQLIKLDFPRLGKISKLCSGTSDVALEYFARANEIRFFPELDCLADWSKLDLMDEDNWSAIQPLIQVINYSNVSEGMVFKAGFSQWQEGKGSFTPVVAPDNDPDWYSKMHADAVGLPAIKMVKDCLAADKAGLSIIAQAKASLQVAQVGKDLLDEVLAAITGSEADKDESDEFNDSEIRDLMGEGEDVIDDVDEDEFFESYFEIEQALTSRLENEEHDTSWDSDLEDDNSDGGLNGEEGDIGQEETKADDGANEEMTLLVDAPKEHYDKSFFFTGVQVTHHKPVNAVVPTKPRKKEEKEEKEEGKEKKKKEIEEYKSRAVLDQAITIAQEHVNGPDCSIRPALEEDHERYKIAAEWTPSEPLMRDLGWARRPTSGGIYGATYMDHKSKETCIKQFNRGVDNKGDKQSPSQTLEIIKEERPGLYCYPAVHEIVRFFNGCVQQFKKDRKKLELKKAAEPMVAQEIKDELQYLLDENCKLTGRPLFELWKKRYGSNRNYDKEKVLQQAKYIRTRMLKDAKKRLKRSMAG